MKHKVSLTILSLLFFSFLGNNSFRTLRAGQKPEFLIGGNSQPILVGSNVANVANLDSNRNSIAITGGFGNVTSSSLSEVVREGTTVDDVSGYYDPLNRQLVIHIEGRTAILQLYAPLIEGEFIAYEVRELIPRKSGNPAVSLFPKLIENSISVFAPTGGGRISLSGNQITGDVTIRSKYIPGHYEIDGNYSYFEPARSQPSSPLEGLATIDFTLRLQE